MSPLSSFWIFSAMFLSRRLAVLAATI